MLLGGDLRTATIVIIKLLSVQAYIRPHGKSVRIIHEALGASQCTCKCTLTPPSHRLADKSYKLPWHV
jgi:hypothetical protein